MKNITDEIIARFERQVGAKPCLTMDAFLEDRNWKRIRKFDETKFDDKYTLQIGGPGGGMLVFYDSFWDAFFIGMRVFQDSHKHVAIICKKANMEVTIAERTE